MSRVAQVPVAFSPTESYLNRYHHSQHSNDANVAKLGNVVRALEEARAHGDVERVCSLLAHVAQDCQGIGSLPPDICKRLAYVTAEILSVEGTSVEGKIVVLGASEFLAQHSGNSKAEVEGCSQLLAALVHCLRKFQGNTALMTATVKALLPLTGCTMSRSYRNSEMQAKLGAVGAVEQLLTTLKHFLEAKDAVVQPGPLAQTLQAIYFTCLHNTHNTSSLAAQGGWIVVKAALSTAGSNAPCQEYACSLLGMLSVEEQASLEQLMDGMVAVSNVAALQLQEKGLHVARAAAWSLLRMATCTVQLLHTRPHMEHQVAQLLSGHFMVQLLDLPRVLQVQDDPLVKHCMDFVILIATHPQLSSFTRAHMPYAMVSAASAALEVAKFSSVLSIQACALMTLKALLSNGADLTLSSPATLDDILSLCLRLATSPRAQSHMGDRDSAMVQVQNLCLLASLLSTEGLPSHTAMTVEATVHSALDLILAHVEQQQSCKAMGMPSSPEEALHDPVHLPDGSALGCKFGYNCSSSHASITSGNAKCLEEAAAAAASLLLWCSNVNPASAGVNSSDRHGNGILHKLSAAGQGEAIMAFLSVAGPQAEMNRSNAAGATPRQLAESRGHHQVVQLLLASMNAPLDKRGPQDQLGPAGNVREYGANPHGLAAQDSAPSWSSGLSKDDPVVSPLPRHGSNASLLSSQSGGGQLPDGSPGRGASLLLSGNITSALAQGSGWREGSPLAGPRATGSQPTSPLQGNAGNVPADSLSSSTQVWGRDAPNQGAAGWPDGWQQQQQSRSSLSGLSMLMQHGNNTWGGNQQPATSMAGSRLGADSKWQQTTIQSPPAGTDGQMSKALAQLSMDGTSRPSSSSGGAGNSGQSFDASTAIKIDSEALGRLLAHSQSDASLPAWIQAGLAAAAAAAVNPDDSLMGGGVEDPTLLAEAQAIGEMHAGEGRHDPLQHTRGQHTKHLWLGNLNTRLPKTVVKAVFETFGPLEDVVTFPGRQYAFVNFRTPEEAARAADALNDREVPPLTGNRKLVVKFRPSKRALGRVSDASGSGLVNAGHSGDSELGEDDKVSAVHSKPSRTTSISSLGKRSNAGTEEEHAGIDGSSSGAIAPSADGVAMSLRDDEDSEVASGDCCDAVITVEGAEGVAGKDGGSQGSEAGDTPSGLTSPAELPEGKPSRHLWLGNIPLKPNKAAMELLFSSFGPLESVRTFPGKTFAFVNFVNPMHAITAKVALDGQPAPAVTANKPLAIRFQKDTTMVPTNMPANAKPMTSLPAGTGIGLDPQKLAAVLATAKGDLLKDSAVGGLTGLGAVNHLSSLGVLLDDDMPPEPAVNLSNRLNPNNVHYDKELAARYKRMNKAEKEALWAQDRSMQQLAQTATNAYLQAAADARVYNVLSNAQQLNHGLGGLGAADLSNLMQRSPLDLDPNQALLRASLGNNPALLNATNLLQQQQQQLLQHQQQVAHKQVGLGALDMALQQQLNNWQLGGNQASLQGLGQASGGVGLGNNVHASNLQMLASQQGAMAGNAAALQLQAMNHMRGPAAGGNSAAALAALMIDPNMQRQQQLMNQQQLVNHVASSLLEAQQQQQAKAQAHAQAQAQVAAAQAAQLSQLAAMNGHNQLPTTFLCPLSRVLMRDPVVAADGVTYDRPAILDWIRQHEVSPMTRQPLANKFLAPNYGMKTAITNELARMGLYRPDV